MVCFTSNMEASSFFAEFEPSWSSWTRYTALDLSVRKAIVAMDRLRLGLSSCFAHEEIAALAHETKSVIRELSDTALNLCCYGRSLGNAAMFNGLMTLSSETSIAIAKTLYLTVALHLSETLLCLLQAPTTEGKTVLLLCDRNEPQDTTECVRRLWMQIIASMESGIRSITIGEHKGAFKMFCLSWPLGLVAQSQMADDEMKLCAIELLRGR